MGWVTNQLQIINIPTVVTSIFSSWFVKEAFDWWKRRNLQSQYAEMQKSLQLQKAEIDQELEVAKVRCQQDIQAHYLQTQLKTALIYKTYPELHSAFKEAEGAVYQFFYHSFMSQDNTYKIWCALTKKLAEHSIFLDDTLRDACVLAKDSLMSGIQASSADKVTKETLMKSIHDKIEVVSSLIRTRLLEESVKDQAITADLSDSPKQS